MKNPLKIDRQKKSKRLLKASKTEPGNLKKQIKKKQLFWTKMDFSNLLLQAKNTMGVFSLPIMTFGSRRRPTSFVHELVDYTGSDQAVRDLGASMETYSADLNAAIETVTTEIADGIEEIGNQRERRMIDRIAEEIDDITRGLYGDSRSGKFKNPRKIILPVLLIGATALIILKKRRK